MTTATASDEGGGGSGLGSVNESQLRSNLKLGLDSGFRVSRGSGTVQRVRVGKHLSSVKGSQQVKPTPTRVNSESTQFDAGQPS
ncbi:hypothetical protein HanIR_Chr02g0070551 [Helianthus annuus]|nr:hypothetical protein HanIR_Chr02g0070551 [Helianthus annuus]